MQHSNASSSSTASVFHPPFKSVENSTVQAIIDKLGSDRRHHLAVEKLVSSIVSLPEKKRIHFVNKLTQACNGFSVFEEAILQLVSSENDVTDFFR